MQVLWPYLLPVLPIAILAKEDFYRRRVGLFWLILSGVSLAIVGYAVEGICVMALHFACNTILAGILFGFIVFWCRIWHRRPFRKFFIHCFGLGDVVLMLIVGLLFAPVDYIRFLLFSNLLALLWWVLLRNKRRKTIPLVGFMAIVLIGYSLHKFFGL